MDTKNIQDKKRKESCRKKYMSGEILAILPAYKVEMVKLADAEVIRHPFNKIKGAALKTGLEEDLNGNKKISQLKTAPQSRYRAFSRRLFGYLGMEGSNFGAAVGLNVIEVPIGYNGSINSHLKIKKNINTIVAMPA